MCVYNLFYEFFTVCTSVLARNEVGQLFHARNLDFGLFLGSAYPLLIALPHMLLMPHDSSSDLYLMSEYRTRTSTRQQHFLLLLNHLPSAPRAPSPD